MKNKTFLLFTTLSLVCSYYIFGYSDSVRGAFFPSLLKTYKLDYVTGGILLSLHYFGYCVAVLGFSFYSGRLAKKIYIPVACATALAGILLYISGMVWLLTLGVFLLGVALGLFEFCGNAIVRSIYPEKKRAKYLNILSSVHSAGAITAPIIFGVLIGFGFGWKSSLLILVPVIACGIFVSAIPQWPEESGLSVRYLMTDYIWALRHRKAIPFFSMALVYISAETGIVLWTVNYFMKTLAYTEDVAGLWLSLFFVLIGVGRFIGGFIVDKVGYQKTLMIAFSGAGAMVFAGVLLPGNFAALIPGAGIFMSIVFPTIAAAISLVCPEKADVTMGVFYAFAAIGGVVGAYIIGQISALYGLKIGFVFVSILCFLGTALAGFAATTEVRNEHVKNTSY